MQGIASLQISPVIERAELDPGASYENNITIVNSGNETYTFEMVASPYQVEDNSYSPLYNVRNAHTQIVDWVTFDDYDEVLEPGEMEVIHYTVNVPRDVPGGSQYAALFAKTTTEKATEGAVRYVASAGMILAAKISGETRLEGSIINTKIPRFLFTPPISATATIKNTGNVEAGAKLTLKVENFFSKEVVYENSLSPDEWFLLPDTMREITTSWEGAPRLGIFKVTLSTEFINDAEVKSRTVFVCPIWFIAIIILIIIVIVVRIAIKKHEEHVTRANSRSGQRSGFNI